MFISSSTFASSNYSKEIQKLLEALDKSDKEKVQSNAKEVVQEAKSKSIGDLVEALLKNVAKDEGLKQTLLATLKNSSLPNNIENTAKELQNLVEVLKEEPRLEKLVSKVEKFLVDIKNITPKNLQTQVQNSGVFFESRLQDTLPNKSVPNSISQTLLSIKETLENLLPNQSEKPAAVVQTLKDFVATLKEEKNLSKAFLQDVQKVLQSVSKDLTVTTQSTKELANIQKVIEIIENPKLTQTFEKAQNALVENTKESLHVKRLETLQSAIDQIKKSLQTPLKDVQEPLKSIVENIKGLAQKEGFSQVVSKLESVVEKVALSESKLQTSQMIQPEKIAQPKTQTLDENQKVFHEESKKIETEVRKELLEIKTYFQDASKSNLLPQKSVDTLTKLIDTFLLQTKLSDTLNPKLENQQILSQPTQVKSQITNLSLPLEFSSKLQNLVELIKTELKAVEPKLSLHVELQKSVEKLENLLHKELGSFTSSKEQELPLKERLSQDIKSTLMQLKEELSNQNTPQAKQMLLHVEKALSNIEYYQLNSYLNNATNFYMPYLWDGLEKGEVSFKRLKEDRFFCEIDLELKDYGRIDLMLMLSSKNNIDISLFTQSKKFLELFRDNIKELRVGLGNLGLVPHNIQLYDDLKSERVKSSTLAFVDATQMDMGVNIKV